MRKIKSGFKNISQRSGRWISWGVFSLGFALVAFAWTVQAGNQNSSSWSQDERNQLPSSLGPEVYNAPAYRVMRDEILLSIREDKNLSPESRHVQVFIEDGVVTLSGKVENPAEQERILNYARESAGMARVANQMEIKIK